LVKRPQPGDPSYHLYQQELNVVLDALREKASLVYTQMNRIPGVKCTEVQGAMYAYPRVDIPVEALEDAKVAFTCS
jgi:alanine transaminase